MCRDVGFVRREVPVGAPEFGRAIPCRCRLADPVWRQARYGLPRPLQRRGFAEFEGRKGVRGALQAARRFARGELRWLALVGQVGCGKTHLLAAIVNTLVEADPGRAVRYWRLPDLLDACKARDTIDGEVREFAHDEEITRLASGLPALDGLAPGSGPAASEVLLLDECLSLHTGDWGRAKIEQIIDARYEAELPLAVALTGDAAALDLWSKRIADRFRDAALALNVFIDADSYRPHRQRAAH